MADQEQSEPGSPAAPERAVEANFPGFLEAAPDAIVIVGRDGRIRLVNGRAVQLFGYPREELLGQSVERLVPRRFRGAHPGQRAGFLAAPRHRSMGEGVDLFALRADGTEFPAEISLGPVETPEGMLVMAAVRDVTARKKAEALNARLAAIVDWSGDAIVATSLEGIIQSWNRGAERVYGYPAEDAIGQAMSMLLPPGRKPEEPEMLERLKRAEWVNSFETVRRRQDGVDINVSVTLSPIVDARGNLTGASSAARDISDRVRAEEAVVRARMAAEAANRELETFSYSVAHDLRAPLRGIDGFSQALLEDYGDKLDDEGRRYLARVRDSAQHMAQLIESLLALARLSQSDISHEGVDLSDLARGAAQKLEGAHPDRHVEFLIAPGLTVEDGDPRLLDNLLENLIGNAWKFTRHRPLGRIEFGCLEDEQPPVFFVRDNGAGFDMAFAPKLFGVFQRLHAKSEFEGTGIGLATVQRIVRRHGGRIWAEGAVDGGATFFFTLSDKGHAR